MFCKVLHAIVDRMPPDPARYYLVWGNYLAGRIEFFLQKYSQNVSKGNISFPLPCHDATFSLVFVIKHTF